MGADGFQGVFRAGRQKPATRPQDRAENQLVGADQDNDWRSHCFNTRCQSRVRACRSSCRDACRAGGRGITTISTGGKRSRFKRNDSRICRLMRLRSTARDDTRRETASPSLGCPPGAGRNNTVKYRSATRSAPANTALYSADRSRRQDRENVCLSANAAGKLRLTGARDPWRDGP